MSSLNSMTFGLRLSAKDETQPALRSAKKGFEAFRNLASKPFTIPMKIGGAGLGLLRDINLGLRPVLTGMDRLIDRGAAVETQFEAFAKFAGKSRQDADEIAKHFQDASQHTLRFGEALTLANQALTTNIPLNQIDRLLAFASRRAAATGETTQGIMAGLISGLGMGSARALKEFGLDLSGVEDSYDRIHGSGAFNNLPFAARQAQILEAAMREIRKEGQLLQFSGKETIFTWKRIKTEIGDSMDRMAAGIAGSEGLRKSLGAFRDVLGGITEHFEGGGGLKELFFGKGEGGGGVMGIARGLLFDLGEAFDRGFFALLAKGGSALLGVLDGVFTWAEGRAMALWDRFGDSILDTWDELESKLLGTFDLLKTKAVDIADAVIDKLPAGLKSFLGASSGSAAPAGQGSPQPAGAQYPTMPKTRRLLEIFMGVDDWNRSMGPEKDPRYGMPITHGPAMNPMLTALFGFTNAAVGAGESMKEGAGRLKRMQKHLAELAAGLMDSGLFAGDSKFMGQLGRFRKDFSPRRELDSKRRHELLGEEFDGFGLTKAGVARLYGERRKLERKVRAIEGQAQRDARRLAGEEERRLRKEGFEVTPEERTRMEARFARELLEQRGGRQLRRLAEIDELLGRHWGGGPSSGASSKVQVDSTELDAAANKMAESAKRIAEAIDGIMDMLGQVMAELTGSNAELSKAGR